MAFGIGMIVLLLLMVSFLPDFYAFGFIGGELFPFFYLGLRNIRLFTSKTAGETNAVLSVTVPTTLSRLIGSFTYF